MFKMKYSKLAEIASETQNTWKKNLLYILGNVFCVWKHKNTTACWLRHDIWPFARSALRNGRRIRYREEHFSLATPDQVRNRCNHKHRLSSRCCSVKYRSDRTHQECAASTVPVLSRTGSGNTCAALYHAPLKEDLGWT